MTDRYRFSLDQLQKLKIKDLTNLAVYCGIAVSDTDNRESLVAKIYQKQAEFDDDENVSVRIRRIRKSLI